MSRMRSIQFGLFIALAFGTTATTSASAASPEWWVEGKVIAAEETVSETVSVRKPATFTVGSLTSECSTVKARKAVIKPSNENSVEALAFSGCKVVGAPNCEVPNFNSEPLILPLGGEVGSIVLDFKPTSGSRIAIIVIKSNGGPCLMAGTYTVTSGTRHGMVCNYPGVETEKVEHELVFTKESGSEVFIKGVAATFEGEFLIKLSSGKKWSAK